MRMINARLNPKSSKTIKSVRFLVFSFQPKVLKQSNQFQLTFHSLITENAGFDSYCWMIEAIYPMNQIIQWLELFNANVRAIKCTEVRDTVESIANLKS